ncbi:ester cyclase [Streptomyces sp. NPDC003393]
MAYANSVEIVEAFWEQVWNAHDPDKADDFVVEDFVITNAGERIEGRDNFKAWIRDFLDQVGDLRLEVAETFQNQDGSRVASRWCVHGLNNGVMGTEADGRPISFSGIAVWAVREDGKLLHNWVERAGWELYRRLTAAPSQDD